MIRALGLGESRPVKHMNGHELWRAGWKIVAEPNRSVDPRRWKHIFDRHN